MKNFKSYIPEAAAMINPIKGRDLVAFTMSDTSRTLEGYEFGFYLQAHGSRETVGTVSKTPFQGKSIKVWYDPDVFIVDYLMYMFKYLKNEGVFGRYAIGILTKEHINIQILYKIFRKVIKFDKQTQKPKFTQLWKKDNIPT